MVNPLDRDETPRRTGIAAIEDIAVSNNVPVNILLALGETAGARDEREMEEVARRAAADLAPRIQSGQQIEDIFTELAGDAAPTFLNRAREIGAQRYPDLMAAVGSQTEPQGGGVAGFAGDAARQFGAGVVSGVGSAIEGAGLLADQVAALGRDGEHYTPGILARAGQAGGDWFRGVSEGLRAGVSDETRQAIANSTPSGDITDLSSISLGENPSLRGYTMMAFDVFGSFLPVVISSFAPGGALTAAGVGGAQGAGSGAETGRAVIDEAYQQRGEDGRSLLEANSPMFRELVGRGMPEDQAYNVVRDSASRLAALFGGSVAGLGGAATGAILHGAVGRAAAGPLERALTAGATSALEEGTQEAMESVAARFGIERGAQMDLNLTEGTFGDFILGALGGGPVGAVSGAMPRQSGRRDDDEDQGTGQGVVVSPSPAVPGGSGSAASVPQDAVRSEPTAGRDRYLGTPVTVQMRGEAQAWEAEIVEETPDGLTVRTPAGETYEIPRVDIEAGDVDIMPVEVDTTQESLTQTPPARDIVPATPDYAEVQAVTSDDAARLLQAIEARARRVGWDDDMREAAAQLRESIASGRPIDPALSQSPATTITRSNGAPFGDEASAQRALGSLGESLDGYEITPVDGGYVARPRMTQVEQLPPSTEDPLSVERGGADDQGRGPLDDDGRGNLLAGMGRGAEFPSGRGGDQPVTGRAGEARTDERGARPDDPSITGAGSGVPADMAGATAPGEPDVVLIEQQNAQRSQIGGNATLNGTPVEVSDVGPWDFKTSFPAPDPAKLAGRLSEGRDDGIDSPEAVAATLDETMRDLQQRLTGIAYWADQVQKVDSGGRPDFRAPRGVDPATYARRQLDRETRDAEDQAAALSDVWGDDAVQAFATEAQSRVEAQLGRTARPESPMPAGSAPQALAAPAPEQPGHPAPAAPPESVDYPNRKLGFRKAKADAPIDGIGDNSDMSLGNIALANARPGDVIPNKGKVAKVTDKQIQIETPDGKIIRYSGSGDKFMSLARDVGGMIAGSANLRRERLGSLPDMIERDPALYYVGGVPQLFDGTPPAGAVKAQQRDQFGNVRPGAVPPRAGQAGGSDAPTATPSGAITSGGVKRPTARPGATSKVPLAQAIRRLGGIAPTRMNAATGETEPTWMARELRHRGITPRTHPFLFNRNGLGDVDNIDPADLGPDARATLGTDDTGNYIDRDALLDALEAEVTGLGGINLDANAGPTRAEMMKQDADREREEATLAEIDAEVERLKLRLVDGERDAILSMVYDGTAIDDAVYSVIERTAIQMEGANGRDQEGTPADVAQSAEMGDVPFGDGPLSGQRPDDAGTEAGSSSPAGQPATADRRGEQGRDDNAVPDRVTGDGVPQAQEPETPLQRAITDAVTRGEIEHVTKRGKTLRGYVVRGDFTKADIEGIDPYTFRKDGGLFVRKENIAKAGVPSAAAPADGAGPTMPSASPEEEAEAQRAAEIEKVRKRGQRLIELAESAIAKAKEDAGRDRLDNTARRARMAANAEADAEKRLSRAKTLKSIGEAILDDPETPLARITSMADVDRLEGELVRARSSRLSQAGLSYGERQKREGQPFTAEETAAVPEPYVLVRPSVGNDLFDAVKSKRGIDRAGLRRIQSNGNDFMRVTKPDTVAAIKGALAVLRKAGPLNYSMKDLASNITDYEALQRMIGDGREGFFAAYLDARNDGTHGKADPMRQLRRDLIGTKIPGFFETPEALARRVVDAADLGPGDRVLEPSAGLGRIANAAAEIVGKGNVDVVEINSRLRKGLEMQGFNVVSDDFTEYDGEGYDAVVMNPPFEDRQDAEHVMRAFGMLKPGGRLVAIMGEGVFFGRDKRAVEFRNWLDENRGTSEQLPAGTFKESGTGTNTRFVEVMRPAATEADTDFAPFEAIGMTPPRRGSEDARFFSQEMPDGTTKHFKVRPVRGSWLVTREVRTNSSVTAPPTKTLGSFRRAESAIAEMVKDGLKPRPAGDEPATPTTERTEAGEQGVLPGAEQSEAQARQRLSDRQRLEMQARQQQSKMRRLGGNEGDAGPLFDTQGDMFAPGPSAMNNPAKPEGSQADTVAAAAQETDPNPTSAQAEAENYKTGKTRWNGLTLSIENAKGSTRRGTGPDGTEWSVTMPAHYGRILRTEGADGDHVDFYMGDMESSDFVVIVNQVDPDTGRFDEHKVVLGTGSRAAALRLYEQGFSDGRGRERIGSDTATTVEGFKAWLENGDMSKPTQPVQVQKEVGENSKPPLTRGKIDDFGAKIGGARKDLWSGYADRMAEAENFDIGDVPLAKSWPEPDYQALIDSGVDPWSVAFVRAARDSIPRKPTGYKRKHWVESVRVMRDFATKLMSGEYERGEIEARMDGNRALEKVAGTVALYETFGHSKSLKGLIFSRNKYSILGGVRYPEGKFRWEVTKEAKATAFSNMPRIIAAGDTQQEAIDAFRPVYEAMSEDGATPGEKKADKRSKFIIWWQLGETPKVYRVGVKIRGNRIALREGITDVAEARRVIAEEGDALQAQLDKMKDIPSERRDENAPRVGADHRGGVDVTPEMFQEAFGFRGVEFGNYVEGSRRQEELNNAYDALLDLAGILDVPSQALSLNGNLALAFGARGSGGKNAPKAHFEPGKVVINLTKRAGRGSLAHEWFHALDNYFAKAREPMRGTYITDNSTPGGPQVVGIRPEVVDAFLAVKSAIAKTDLRKRSANLDRLRTNQYWGTGIEMHARAFESYVIAKLEDQSASNDYLANVVDGAFWSMLAEASGLGDSYPYLKADEIETVRPAFDALFSTIETKQTERGVAMYSRRRTPLYSGTLRAAEALPMKRGTGPQFLSMLSKQPGVKAEELDWIGLRDFLRGKDKVTRDEVLEHIRQNQVQVVEYHKGDMTSSDDIRPSPTVIAKHQEEWDRLSRDINAARAEADAARDEMREQGWAGPAGKRFSDATLLADRLEDERDQLHEQMVDETIKEIGGLNDKTQYDEWRTPGGRQYRELLLAMPSRVDLASKERAALRAEQSAFRSQMHAKYGDGFVPKMNERERAEYDELINGIEAADVAYMTAAESDQWPFESSHWSERNVLAHIRFDERDTRDGRTLFIQEIQSDWHQAGRKKGYRGKIDTTGWTAKKDEGGWVVRDAEGREVPYAGKHLLEEDVIAAAAEGRKERAVPDAPLKKTWHETAFRRSVAWAVEHGFDSVTWATGDMNADVFSLDSRIAAIEWTWHPETQEVEIQAEAKGPNADDLSMWRDRETLDDAVGREMADRINRDIDAGKTTDTYRGLDLRVGGEGMRGFYDKIIPNYAAKWGKRFGAKIGKVKVGNADVWHMPITDAMRATVQMEGVALFKRGEAPAAVASAKADAVKADLQAAWSRMSIPDEARLRVVDHVFGMDPDGNTVPVDGLYVRGLVQVALDSHEGTFATLHHEAIHALRDAALWGRPYGLFSEGEWNALETEARRSWMGKYGITETYPDLTPSQQLEEAIAAAFADHMTRKTEPNDPPLRRAIRRAAMFFRALGRALRGAGVQDTDTIFGRVASGAVGRRGGREQAAQGVGGRAVEAFSRAPAERNADGTFASNAVKYSRRLLAEDGPVTDKAERGIIGQILTDAMGGRSSRYNILALVPGEPLYQELAKNLPSARTYLKLKHAMSAMRNKMQADAAGIMDDWRSFLMRNRKQNDAMMDLMHDATRAGLDPAAPFTVRARRQNESHAEYGAFAAARRSEYQALKERWDRLPKRAQEIYRKVRDSYVDVSKQERQIIEDNVKAAMEINLKRARQKYEDELNRIEEDGLEGDERMEAEEKAAAAYSAVRKRDGYGRAARLRSLRLMLESNTVEAPYFPLLRHGQYFVTVKDANGKIVSFSKSETERQQSKTAADARKEFGSDHEIITGLMSSQDAAPDVDPMFVADIESIVGDAAADPALMDAIWQRYLETLPDFSMRKSHLHRKGTPGFSRDAFRNFARQMFHSAHQLARLKHGMRMQLALDDVQREAAKADDPNRAGTIANEMARRHDWIMNPQSSAWSTWATSAAFVYYLGMTPAAALVNLSQTVIVGIPVMAAGFKKGGVASASRHLMRALREFGAGTGAVERAKSLTTEERAAIKEAYDSGVIDKSQSHDLAGVSETGVEYSDIRHRLMAPIAFMFHHTERLNREITFLASYRMARVDGMDHETAIDKAGAMTWKIHFNYESDSRPRLQHKDWVRVATVFRNFQLNMLYRLFRDTHQAIKGRTAEDRKEARSQLLGITGMMMLSAGVTGTWGYALMMTLAGMVMPGAGADDIEKEIKNALVDVLGRDVAGLILNGVPGHLTGIDLSNRVGMPELWIRSPDRQLEGDDLYNYWAQQFLGAVPGMAQSVFRGVSIAAGGDVWRGAETAAPKFIRDIMRGIRYSQDGVTTISGNSILESVPPMDALTQALGFTPAEISERYEANRWMMNENSEIQRARTSVLNSIWRDVRDGGDMSERTIGQLNEFNSENPDYAIDRGTIRRSIQSRARGAADTVGGVRLNNRIEARIRANAPVSIYEAAQ